MKAVWKFAACAAGALLLAACGGKPLSQATAAAPGPPLRTVVIAPVRTPAEWRLDGAVEAIDHATVAAQTSGRVEAIYYDVGDHVPQGAVIIRLRATEQHAGLLQAKAALRAAAARALEAQTRYRRILDMYDRQVVPKANLDQATADRDAAAAQLSAAQAALLSAEQGVAYTQIRAPYAGVVTQRLVQVGETVAPGTALMSGLSLQRLVMAAAVLIVIYNGFTIAGNASRHYDLQVQTDQLNQQIASDKVELQRLDALRRYMQSDEFIEASARAEGLVMPGDTAILVNAPAAPATPVAETPNAWWERYFSP